MRRFLQRVALLAASLLLMAICGEVVLRVSVGSPVTWAYPQEHYLPDAEIGYRLAPSQSAFTHDKLFETNSVGIRAVEAPRQRRPGTRRLLALGDSQTAGEGLVLADTWPAQLATHLSDAHCSEEWEVLNGGLSGASTWHYARLLRRLADRYEIDGVVIALYVNDVTPDPPVLRMNVVTNTPANRIIYLLKRSALFTAIWRARGPVLNTLGVGGGPDRETRIITGEHDDLLEQGWHDVEKNLLEMRDVVRARGLRVWLLVLPRRDQVGGTQDGAAYEQRAAAIGERLDLPVIDVLSPMVEAYEQHGREMFIAWDGHNSAITNRLVAEELTAVILAEGCL